MLARSEELAESPMLEVPPISSTSLSETTSWTIRLLAWIGHAGWVRGDAGVSHVEGAARSTNISKTASWTLRLLTWTGHGWVRGDAGVSHVGGATSLEDQLQRPLPGP
jgi:hypothetical protein